MLTGKYPWLSTRLEAGPIAVQNGSACVVMRNPQMIGIDRKVRAGGQSYQVDRIRHPAGFVEIIDAPDQTAFGVSPGAEILHMQIADGQNFRCIRCLGRDLRPQLRPAIEGRAQKRKQCLAHDRMFALQVFGNQPDLASEPFLIIRRGFAKADHYGSRLVLT